MVKRAELETADRGHFFTIEEILVYKMRTYVGIVDSCGDFDLC
jgi:hypothetical protein